MKIESEEIQNYKEIAKRARMKVLEIIYKTKSPHIGGSFSCVDILVALYFRILNVDPKNKTDENRDIFILSKGHACLALYAVLAEKGFIKKEILENYGTDGSLLEGHPKKNLDFGIELSTGSLGQGLSVGVGMALARKKDGIKSKVFVLLSEGDMQEGSAWEALLFSSHHKLNNLTAIVDYNKLQILGKVKEVLGLEPLRQKLEAFGWQVMEVDGHDFRQLIEGFQKVFSSNKNKPIAIIAHTKKGKGVSFMENNLLWHSKYPNEEEYNRAIREL